MHPGKTDTMVLDFVNEADDIELKRTGDPALGFAERSGLVVEHQWATLEEGRLARRLKNAQITIDASVEEIDFSAARGLDRAVISDLAELSFLRAAGNVIVTGATGLGKTCVACALADRACRYGPPHSTSAYRVSSSSSRSPEPTEATSRPLRRSRKPIC